MSQRAIKLITQPYFPEEIRHLLESFSANAPPLLFEE